MQIPQYCREIETYLCQKNDGHLIRVVGPSFELVSRWAAEGVPLKVAFSGIDRYVERGTWEAAWDGRSAGGDRASAGVYFVGLRGEDFAAARKLLILR